MTRKWKKVGPQHLELVVESAARASEAMNTAAESTASCKNLLTKAEESKENLGSGRRLVDLTGDRPADEQMGKRSISSLRAPVLVDTGGAKEKQNPSQPESPNKENGHERKMLPLPLGSDSRFLAEDSAKAMRNVLAARESVRISEVELQNLQHALSKQQKTLSQLREKHSETQSGQPLQHVVNVESNEANCERVISQLTNTLSQTTSSHQGLTNQLNAAETKATRKYRNFIETVRSHSDPILGLGRMSSISPRPDVFFNRNCALEMTFVRQASGGSLSNRQFGVPISRSNTARLRKSVLFSRLSHVVTINSHLTYPIYCLRFDRTGRFFVTGADDCLVKLFCIGVGQSPVRRFGMEGGGVPRRLRFNYGANIRGAVLVCTLRGHAGVICDIDVSSDNSFLATASDDGDVRIWGLKDGCPIAILRGHAGGANMVRPLT